MTGSAQHASPAPLPQVIGWFVVEGSLGIGGMSQVLRVRSGPTGERFALKMPHPLPVSDRTAARLEAEAEALRSLTHPNIAQFRAFGYDRELNTPWLALELIRGGSLAAITRGRTVPIGLLIEWGRQALSALDAVHRAGMVHRDVKPGNLLLSREHQIKLVDFGVAHVPQRPVPTSPDALLGTLAFMAPEQQAHPDQPLATSDLYGLAASLFKLATGAQPFGLADIEADDPRWCAVPYPLRSVLFHATRADPADRPADAQAMAAELSALTGWS